MAALRSGDDALSTGKEHTGIEGLELRDVYTVHIAVLDELADDHAGTVVTQTTGVDIARLEIVAEGVHRQQRCIACLVAEVVAELAAGELRAAVRLGSDELDVLALEDLVAHEWEGNAAEVGTAAEAGNHYIGELTCHLHLLLSLKADDGLVEADVVQHGAEGVFTVRSGGGQLDSLGNGGAERT